MRAWLGLGCLLPRLVLLFGSIPSETRTHAAGERHPDSASTVLVCRHSPSDSEPHRDSDSAVHDSDATDSYHARWYRPSFGAARSHDAGRAAGGAAPGPAAPAAGPGCCGQPRPAAGPGSQHRAPPRSPPVPVASSGPGSLSPRARRGRRAGRERPLHPTAFEYRDRDMPPNLT
jgi:hypothetical protein